MKETESPEPTPEQLLQILDAQLAAKRSHRTKTDRNRATILVAGVLVILAAAGAALLILDHMLMDLHEGGRPVTPAAATPLGKF